MVIIPHQAYYMQEEHKKLTMPGLWELREDDLLMARFTGVARSP